MVLRRSRSVLGKGLAENIKAEGGGETDDTQAADALINGYLDRAIDAYSRAYSTAKTNNKLTQTYKDGLHERLETLFDLRYGKRDGMEKVIAQVSSTPFPDPETEVKPVFDPPVSSAKPAPAVPGKKP